ncbi:MULTISPECIES: DUF3306 domain-containing protein [unclassified Salipiger]|uniref:DUF3306 domain-containing protein n=1 Tax=unclassified Salipiger TaxID=2640570 RepID=UPI0013BD486A|nr:MULTISPECIES: DUF3306 domain-containing protein [unclassified Salipiger]NDV53435.1 DUF3306 domain-containing protein [Salipiger sp. PrR003]NDW35162.1 DUF3306 domain-containing protein [Salipiger sp. PrR007]
MKDFWSRRKAAVAAETRSDEQAQDTARRAETEAQLAERSDEELLAEAGLPAPEEITDGEMVRKFLESQLPKRLKNRALRALWRSNPVLACLDGLNDYDTDFTGVTPAADFKTTYQVGKGLLAHLEYVGRQQTETESAEPQAEEDQAEIADADSTSIRAPETLGPTIEAQPEIPPLHTTEPQVAEAAQIDPEPEESALPASARRMRFSFEAS